jgi:hypothetical protein
VIAGKGYEAVVAGEVVERHEDEAQVRYRGALAL